MTTKISYPNIEIVGGQQGTQPRVNLTADSPLSQSEDLLNVTMPTGTVALEVDSNGKVTASNFASTNVTTEITHSVNCATAQRTRQIVTYQDSYTEFINAAKSQAVSVVTREAGECIAGTFFTVTGTFVLEG